MKIAFHKYQSLGNDFVLIDAINDQAHVIDTYVSATTWKNTVQLLCDRQKGIGADGILILKLSNHGIPHVRIFNADGSEGSNCLNGARCVMHYLYTHKSFVTACTMQIGSCMVKSRIQHSMIEQQITNFWYHGMSTISTEHATFTGHIVTVGNPHFIIFQETTPTWLEQHGRCLAYHESFADGINVEFITPKTYHSSSAYNILVYERGCGITQACSSGAAAITFLLAHLKQLSPGKSCELTMPGGDLTTLVSSDHTEEKLVTLCATAEHIFSDTFSLKIINL